MSLPEMCAVAAVSGRFRSDRRR